MDVDMLGEFALRKRLPGERRAFRQGWEGSLSLARACARDEEDLDSFIEKARRTLMIWEESDEH